MKKPRVDKFTWQPGDLVWEADAATEAAPWEKRGLTKRQLMADHGPEIGRAIAAGRIGRDAFKVRGGYSFYRGLAVHRLVLAGKLGRPLRDHENAHHINGHRSDNRPENLQLWSVSQPPGQRAEDKTAWAMEWLLKNAAEHPDAEEMRTFAQRLFALLTRRGD